MCLIGAPLSLSLLFCFLFPYFVGITCWNYCQSLVLLFRLLLIPDTVHLSSLAWWGQVQCVEERTLSGPEVHMRTSEDAPGLMDVISISRDTLEILYLGIMIVVLWISGFYCTCVHSRKMHHSSLPLPSLLFPRNVFNLKFFLTRSEGLRTQVYRS